jgi:hypothetical protein
MGPARVVELFSSWSAEGTLTYPHAFKVLRDGSTVVEGKLTALKLNPAVTDAAFQKPAP